MQHIFETKIVKLHDVLLRGFNIAKANEKTHLTSTALEPTTNDLLGQRTTNWAITLLNS